MRIQQYKPNKLQIVLQLSTVITLINIFKNITIYFRLYSFISIHYTNIKSFYFERFPKIPFFVTHEASQFHDFFVTLRGA